MSIDNYKFQFVEQTKADSLPIRRAQLYALYQCIAFVGRISKGASEYRMLLCSLQDKLFLKNPPASGGAFCYAIHSLMNRKSQQLPPVPRVCVRSNRMPGRPP